MKVTGAGNAELPLDVHYASAADWLRDRGKLSKHWQRELRAVRARVDKALAEARPAAAGAAEALRDEPVGYDACVRVVQALRDAGLDKRTMLGGYSDPCMKQWAAIVALYEREHLHVAELCQRLMHNATYELPAVRKELEHAEAGLQEASRRRTESARALEAARERLAAERAKLGIAGALAPLAEVRALAGALPGVFHGASERLAAQATLDAVRLYRGWAAACFSRLAEEAERAAAAAAAEGAEGGKGGGKGSARAKAAQAAAAASAGSPRPELLLVLTRAHAAGVLPAAEPAGVELSAAGAAAAEIDWGGEGEGGGDGGGGGEAQAVEISWGDEDEGGAGSGGGAVEIDWGGETEGAAEAGAGAAVEIDWGGEGAAVDVAGGAAVEIDWGGGEGGEADAAAADWIEVEASGEADGGADGTGASEPAGGAAALRLYEDAAERSGLVNDLLELEAFLRQRLAEERGADPQLLAALSAWPDFSQLQVGAEALRALLAHVEGCRQALDCARTRQLLLIQASESYAERLAAGVQAGVDRCERAARKADEALERLAAARAEKATALPRHASLLASARGQKERLAAEIARLFDGRAVNVMGALGEDS